MAALFANAASPLTTPTYDGSGQTVHPSVIDFLAEYGMATWRGYRYWMAHTPYPGGNDDYENPSLLASHDGTTWVTPPGINNPLTAGRPGFDAGGGAYEETGGWNADPDLVYDPAANVLRLYFASAEYDHEGVSYFACAESGHSDTFPFVRTNVGCMSPTIVRESASKWHLWDCQTGLRYRFSADGITWGAPQMCSIPYGAVWHVEVKRNPHNGSLEMLFNTGFDLYHFASAFESPTVWTRVFDDQPTYAIERSASGWDSTRIYRSSLSFDPVDPLLRRVWYSALGTLGWRVGYTQANIPAVPDAFHLMFDLYSLPESVAGEGAVTFEASGAAGALEAGSDEDTFALTFDLYSQAEAIAGDGTVAFEASGQSISVVLPEYDLDVIIGRRGKAMTWMYNGSTGAGVMYGDTEIIDTPTVG